MSGAMGSSAPWQAGHSKYINRTQKTKSEKTGLSTRVCIEKDDPRVPNKTFTVANCTANLRR